VVLAIVCASNGYTARGLVRGLASLSVPKRMLLWRSPGAAASGPLVSPVMSTGVSSGIDAIKLDPRAPEQHAAALDGVSDLLVLPSFDSQLIAQQAALVDAAPARGVKRVHVVSLGGADSHSPARCLRWLGQVERRVLATKLPHSVLRCAPFMQNIPLFLDRSDGALSLIGPFRHTAFNWIDAEDVGAILARLIASGEPSTSLEAHLNGPNAADFDHVAAELGAAISQPVAYHDVSNPEAQGRLESHGMPADRAIAITEYWDYLVSGVVGGVVGSTRSDAIAEHLGRAPRRLSDFIAEWANELRAAA
jgi:uncharacterized protein YbjT (DUF2867 family)